MAATGTYSAIAREGWYYEWGGVKVISELLQNMIQQGLTRHVRSIKQRVKWLGFSLMGLTPGSRNVDRFVEDGHPWAIDLATLGNSPTIYVFGIGDDLSFEIGLLSQIRGKIHIFDPTPTVERFVDSLDPKIRSRLVFSPIGIGSRSGRQDYLGEYDRDDNLTYLYSAMPSKKMNEGSEIRPVVIEQRSVGDLMEELAHSSVSLLKLDVEGNEYEVLQSLIDSPVEIRQIAVEFHYRFRGHSILETWKLLNRLKRLGYQIRYTSPWCEEFLLVREK